MPHLDRGGVRVWYEARGAGPSVLLTHGYSATGRMWAPQIRGLADRYRLIVWDIRGHGESDSPEDPAEYSETLSVEDMAAILDACGAERAAIGGLSLGGYLSLAFHLAHPERTTSLLLCDTGPGYRNDEAREKWNRMAESFARGLEDKGLASLGSGVEVRAAQHHSAKGLAAAARGILKQNDARVIDSLPSIRVPAIVVWGERDEAFAKPGEYMAMKIPGAKKVVIPEAGHAANLDQPEAFNAAVLDFLQSAVR
jgi:pimeloyl-ACP methyl ester carboxylesterase